MVPATERAYATHKINYESVLKVEIVIGWKAFWENDELDGFVRNWTTFEMDKGSTFFLLLMKKETVI